MREERSESAWKLGLGIIILMYGVRELTVWLFAISPKTKILCNNRVLLDTRNIESVLLLCFDIFGMLCILMVGCLMYGMKGEEDAAVRRNAAIGTIIGCIAMVVLPVPLDMLYWVFVTFILTGCAGFLMGISGSSFSVAFISFGVPFGAAIMLSVMYGFAIGGALLFIAFWVGALGSVGGELTGYALRVFLQKRKWY